MANSPLYDDVLDSPTEAKKLTVARSRERLVVGIVAFWLSVISVVLFVAAASLVQADRTARVPVVTWGRAAALSAILGGIASVAGGVLSIVGLTKDSRSFRPAALGWILSFSGVFVFLFYLAALYED